MAHSFLIFDFGGDEDVAQQARHRIDGWRQGFRLDKKLQLKIERSEPEENGDTERESPSKAPKGSSKAKSAPKTKSGAKTKSTRAAESGDGSTQTATSEIRMIVRLDFSDHEKLSHHRWLERIPTEEPFKTAKPKIVRATDSDFAATEELFDSLD